MRYNTNRPCPIRGDIASTFNHHHDLHAGHHSRRVMLVSESGSVNAQVREQGLQQQQRGPQGRAR